MERRKRAAFLGGLLLLAGAAAMMLTVFSLLSRTGSQPVYLRETAAERRGWRYEVLSEGTVTEVEPGFPDEYSCCLPGPAEAIRMSRTMTEDFRITAEDIIYPILEMEPYDTRVEAFLDDKLLVSDFHGGERDENGFMRLTDEERAAMEPEYRALTALLPSDYMGRTLTIIVYYAQPRWDPEPPFPTVRTERADYASFVVGSVPETAKATAAAILTLAVLTVFLLDSRNGEPDERMLLLALYFLLLFLDEAYNSTAGSVSLLYERMNLLFLTDLYMAPLYLYLALYFTGWKRVALSAVTAGWAAYEGVHMYLALRAGELAVSLSHGGRGAYYLALLFIAAFLLGYVLRWHRERERRPRRRYVILAAVVAVAQLFYAARQWISTAGPQGLTGYLWMLVRSAGILPREYPDYFPIVHYITSVSSVTAVCVLVAEFFRRTVETRRTVGVLAERSRQTMEGYERLLRAEEATGAVRHEMRHHMTALAGFLDSGETDRAREYIAELSDQLDRLPTGRYSRNMLVNVLAGSYLERAQAEGVRVEHSLSVPPSLGVADEDMSVLLTNMLENALNACRRLGPGRDRYIRVKMYVHENFLFVGCVNSAPEEQEEERPASGDSPRRHGYGMEAMARVAEKYDSALKVDRTPGQFSVKSCLRMRERQPEGPSRSA